MLYIANIFIIQCITKSLVIVVTMKHSLYLNSLSLLAYVNNREVQNHFLVV
jgi:hypothetical protein